MLHLILGVAGFLLTYFIHPIVGGILGVVVAEAIITRKRLEKIDPSKTGWSAATIVEKIEELELQVASCLRRLDKLEADREELRFTARDGHKSQPPPDEHPKQETIKENPATIQHAGFEVPSLTIPSPAATSVIKDSASDETYGHPPKAAASQKRYKQEDKTDKKKTKEDISDHLYTKIERIPKVVIDFFTTGNIVTKVGIIVLFFGFSFLLKYAAQRNMFPIELRLIAVFLSGLGLLGIGWFFREKRKAYALLLQGGGIGITYLTVFAAARLYELVPHGLSFAMMLCLVALMGALSVLQNAKAMAVAGIIGGFIAPILMSTGKGSHVMLFSYYAFLNAGILGIAWFKAWRKLNIIGFFFTFVIGTLWGGSYYSPEYFSSTEPFLILFFLFYVLVAILFAIRTPYAHKNYIDGTLVFGTPVIVFGLQYCLVKDMEYGLAFSAMVIGLFYIIVARVLWEMVGRRFRTLAEAYLAFGVVFGSLAIPLALDGRWTSAAWALEGAAILWVGIRQERLPPRLFGLILQAGGGLFFLSALSQSAGPYPVFNSTFTGCVLICLTAFFSSWQLMKNGDRLLPWEQLLQIPLVCWGLLWWFAAGAIEIDRFITLFTDKLAIGLLYCVFTFLALYFIGKWLSWKFLVFPAVLHLPVMIFSCLLLFACQPSLHMFHRLWILAWPASLAAHYFLLHANEKTWPERYVSFSHLGSLWLGMLLVTCEGAYWIQHLGVSQSWQYFWWGLFPGFFIILILRFGQRIAWPVQRFYELYVKAGVAIPLAVLLAFACRLFFYHGDPAPLSYIPLLNPVELIQLFVLLTALLYLKWNGALFVWYQDLQNKRWLSLALYVALFILLNTMVARTIHFHTGIPYSLNRLGASFLFQTSISLLWGITALGTTVMATRRQSRPAWITGAVILVMVVGKLFLVDLAGKSTVARIVSFLGVGALMLLIGYFSPLPPSTAKEDS